MLRTPPAPIHSNNAGKILLENPVDLIQTLEQEEIARLNKTIPAFAPGDTVIVSVSPSACTTPRCSTASGGDCPSTGVPAARCTT